MPTPQNQEEPPDNVPDLPPVLPGEELDDLEGEDVYYGSSEDEDDIGTDTDPGGGKQPRKTGRKRHPKRETVAQQVVSRSLDIGDWIDSIEARYGSYEQPGVMVQLERLAPLYQNGVTIGGILDRWECRKPDVAAIIDEWGGGDFRLKVQIQKPDWKLPKNLAKNFRIGGHEPQIKRPRVPLEAGGGLGPASAASLPPIAAPAAAHPIVEKRALDLVSEQLAYERKSRGGGIDMAMLKQFEGTYRTTAEQVMQAAELRAQQRETVAAQQIDAAERRVNEAQAMAEAARREAERIQQETADRVARATAESQSLLGVLLPTFNENAATQVTNIARTYEQREARIEAQHVKEIDALYRQHEADMRNTLAQHQAEMTRLETVYNGQLQMLQMRVQQLDHDLAAERQQNNVLRNEMMSLRAEETQRLLKQADPIAKLQEFGSLRDVVGDILPGGGGGDGDGLSDDAPDWMKMINSVAGSLGPAIGQIIEARAGTAGNAGAAQQLALMQHQQLLAAQAQAQAQAVAPAPAPAPAGSPQAIAAARVTFDRSELEPAVAMLAAIRNAGSTAADAASAATKHVPHNVLRELARRTPSKVVEQLESAGILPPDLRTQAGNQFVIDFLSALREIVS